jgi:hypothetical protein
MVKKMKSEGILLIVAMALCIALFAGCASAPAEEVKGESAVAPAAEEPKGGDCGENIDCFISAAETCTEASMVRTTSINLFGMIATAKSLMEIRGIEGGKCSYYQRTLENSVSFSNEMIEQARAANKTDEEIAAQLKTANDSAKSTVGFEVTCEFDTAELASMLKRWKAGTASSSDLAGCTQKIPET